MYLQLIYHEAESCHNPASKGLKISLQVHILQWGHEKQNPCSTGPTDPKMAYSFRHFECLPLWILTLNGKMSIKKGDKNSWTTGPTNPTSASCPPLERGFYFLVALKITNNIHTKMSMLIFIIKLNTIYINFIFIYLFIYSNIRFYISGTHLIDGAFTMWYMYTDN